LMLKNGLMKSEYSDLESGKSKIFGIPRTFKIFSIKFVDIKKIINRLKGQNVKKYEKFN